MEFIEFLKNNLGHVFPLLIAGGIAVAIMAERFRTLALKYPMKNPQGFF
jgi:hypothetical protein